MAGRVIRPVQAGMIAAAAAGGALFDAMGFPGGWLSGAMIALALMAAAGRAAPLADPLRQAAMILSGCAIGSAVTPQMLHGFGRYPASIALMGCAVVAITLAGVAILRRVPGFSPETAFFSAIPGALSYVFAVAAATQADMARIAVVQVLRVFFLMALLPLAVVEAGVPLAPAAALAHDPTWVVALALALAYALGTGLERLGVAGGMLFGAMIASGALHATGVAPGRLPDVVAIAGQVLVGAWTGARFAGFDWGLLGRLALVSLGSFAVTMGIAAGFAGLASAMLGLPFPATLLAFAPGGLEAMTILAFALGIDPLYVGAHHLARFVLISLALPVVARLWLGGGAAK